MISQGTLCSELHTSNNVFRYLYVPEKAGKKTFFELYIALLIHQLTHIPILPIWLHFIVHVSLAYKRTRYYFKNSPLLSPMFIIRAKYKFLTNIFFCSYLKPVWTGVHISIVVEIFSIDQRAGLSIYLAIAEAPIKTHASTEPTSLVHNNASFQEFV